MFINPWVRAGITYIFLMIIGVLYIMLSIEIEPVDRYVSVGSVLGCMLFFAAAGLWLMAKNHSR